MNDLQKAIEYFDDAIKESDEIISECSEALQNELIEQKEYFIIALKAMKSQVQKEVVKHKRIPGIGKCPVCKTELCINDENLHYCPTCGQALKIMTT